MDRPPAVEIAVWLNQYRRGQISATDTANSLEYLTDSMRVSQAGELKPWLDLVNSLPKSDIPFFSVLPVPGKPYGLTAELLKSIDPQSGVVILGKNLILALIPDGLWSLLEVDLQPTYLDASSVRRHFLELVEKSAKLLASLDLQADRRSIDEMLAELRPIYLPPMINRKSLADLDLATRVWVIADHGLVAATSHESPSKDQARIAALTNLKSTALELMAATSTVA